MDPPQRWSTAKSTFQELQIHLYEIIVHPSDSKKDLTIHSEQRLVDTHDELMTEEDVVE